MSYVVYFYTFIYNRRNVNSMRLKGWCLWWMNSPTKYIRMSYLEDIHINALDEYTLNWIGNWIWCWIVLGIYPGAWRTQLKQYWLNTTKDILLLVNVHTRSSDILQNRVWFLNWSKHFMLYFTAAYWNLSVIRRDVF